MRKTKIQKAREKQVDNAFRRVGNGIQISIWDMGKVYTEGYRALDENRDLDSALTIFLETIRKN